MKMRKRKLAIAVLGLIAGGNAAAAGTNKVYMDNSGNIDNLTVSQSQTGLGDGNNSIGSAVTDFTVSGGWDVISITQEYNAAAPVTPVGNSVTGSITASGGAGATSSLTIVQTGTENGIVLDLGSVSALANPTLSLTQTGDSNTSTYTLDNGGDTTVTETLTGDSNTVDVTSTSAVTAFSSTIAVTGDSNDIDTSRSGAGSYTDDIEVYGNSNIVDLTGTATGTNSVTLDIGANGAAVNSNSVTVTQSGSDNTMTLDLNGASNTLALTQSSATASLTATLTGGSSTLDTNQSGSNATGIITVTGSTNDLDLIQSGANAYASVNVSTSNSTISVTQTTADAVYNLNGTLEDSSTVIITQ